MLSSSLYFSVLSGQKKIKIAFAVIVLVEGHVQICYLPKNLKGYMIIEEQIATSARCNRPLMTQRRIPPAVAVRIRKFCVLQEPIRLQDLLNSAR